MCSLISSFSWLRLLPGLHVQLLLQLSNLCLQGGHVGLVFGLDCSLQLLQLQLQLLVLTLHLGASSLQTLRGAALCRQLHIHLVSLKERDTVISCLHATNMKESIYSDTTSLDVEEASNHPITRTT